MKSLILNELESKLAEANARLTQTMRIDADGTVTPLFDEKLLRMAEQRAEKAERACAEMRDIFNRMPSPWHSFDDCVPDGHVNADKCDDCRLNAKIEHALSSDAGKDYIHKSELEAAQASARKWQEKALQAVEDEREACAQIAAGECDGHDLCGCEAIVDAIRARGKK